MKLMQWIVAAALSGFCAVGTLVAQTTYEEGKEYKKLSKPQPTDSGAKVEVIEFFSFSCPHCRDLEPSLQAWKKTMPADVQFRRMHVNFLQHGPAISKILYTLEALGDVDGQTQAVFDAIHRDGKKMHDKDVFYAWAQSRGLDAAKVKSAYEGFSVDSKVKRADQATKAYNIESVPLLVVDGKYVTGPGMLKGSHAGVPAALDFLIAKARKEKATK